MTRIHVPRSFWSHPLPTPVSRDRKGCAPRSSLCILFCLGRDTLEEPGDLNCLGYLFRKPSLSSTSFPVCGHAADTNKNHACHSGLRSPFVASDSLLNPVVSMGRELPKPLDLQDGEGCLGKVLKCCAHFVREGTRCSSLFPVPQVLADCKPGRQGCALFNRCFSPGPLLLLWLSHSPSSLLLLPPAFAREAFIASSFPRKIPLAA